jgi:hypothetical protein
MFGELTDISTGFDKISYASGVTVEAIIGTTFEVTATAP